jgi:hypothetical protein
MIMGGEVYLGDASTVASWTIGRQLGLQIAAHILSPFGIARSSTGSPRSAWQPEQQRIHRRWLRQPFIHMTGMSDLGWNAVRDRGPRRIWGACERNSRLRQASLGCVCMRNRASRNTLDALASHPLTSSRAMRRRWSSMWRRPRLTCSSTWSRCRRIIPASILALYSVSRAPTKGMLWGCLPPRRYIALAAAPRKHWPMLSFVWVQSAAVTALCIKPLQNYIRLEPN